VNEATLVHYGFSRVEFLAMTLNGFNHKNAKQKRGGTGLQNIMARVTILKAKIF
jgi:hypothetical protein